MIYCTLPHSFEDYLKKNNEGLTNFKMLEFMTFELLSLQKYLHLKMYIFVHIYETYNRQLIFYKYIEKL